MQRVASHGCQRCSSGQSVTCSDRCSRLRLLNALVRLARASTCNACSKAKAKRLSGKIEDRSERPVATRRMSGDNSTGPRERGLSEPESRGSLSISAACSTSFPPVNSPHIAVSARTSSSGSPRYPSNPRAATAPQFSNPPAPKHKHHGWRSKYARGARLRLDGGRPQEVV